GEMEIGEEHLSRLEPSAFLRLRLLHLDDELRCREHLVGARRDAAARRLVGGIVEAHAGAGAALDDDAMAAMGQLAHAPRHEADAVFVRLHLLRHADQHQAATFSTAPSVAKISSIWRRSMTSGGDSAMMSPVERTRRPRS